MRKVSALAGGLSVSFIALVVGAAPALAQDKPAAGSATDYSEIVVTAQKRPERLRDIPVAASVLSSRAIEQAHVSDLSDINKVVPSVEIKSTFNGRVPYGIRGISTNANEGAIGLTSGVSIQLDGVPVPADSFAANTISDVAQLEVLKGPQATLGGRTASAGVINFVTNGPTETLKGKMSALVAEDSEYRIDANLSGPVTKGVLFSLSGYYTELRYPVRNIQLNENSKPTSFGIRGKLKFEITPDFDATFTGHYALSKSTGEVFAYQYVTPGATIFPFIGGGLPQSVALAGYTVKYGNTSYSSPVHMSSRYEDKDGSLVLNYRTDGLTFTSTTSYFRENQYQSQDLFMTSVLAFNVLTGGFAPPFNNQQSSDGYVRQVTQEFKVASDNTKPISFLAGAFYSDMTVNQYGLRSWVGFPGSKTTISNTKNYALYARVTGRLNDTFTVIGGLRYYWDQLGWNQTQYFNPTLAPALAQYQGCGGPVTCTWNLSDKSSGLVGDIAFQAHLNADTMAYASYTRGYKPRAYNTAHDWVSLQSAPAAADTLFTTPTKREDIDSFEVGLKATALDHHLSFNLAAFYTKYSGYQAQIFDNSKLIGILVLSNAAAQTSGVEADINWQRDNTSVSLSAAYIDAKFKNFAGANCYPTQTAAQGCVNGAQDLSDRPLPASPKFKMNATVEQRIPLNAFDIILGTNLAYRSSTIMQADGNPETRQGEFALLDASIGLQTKNKQATVTLFVNNITNRFYLSNAEDFFSGLWGANAVLGMPARDSHRYFGGRLNLSF